MKHSAIQLFIELLEPNASWWESLAPHLLAWPCNFVFLSLIPSDRVPKPASQEELSGLTARLPRRPRAQSLVCGKHPINDSRLRKMRKRVHYSVLTFKETPLLGATHTPSGEQEGLDRETGTLNVKTAQCTSSLQLPGKKKKKAGLNLGKNRGEMTEREL